MGSAADLPKIAVRSVITHLSSCHCWGIVSFHAGFLLGHKIAVDVSGVLIDRNSYGNQGPYLLCLSTEGEKASQEPPEVCLLPPGLNLATGLSLKLSLVGRGCTSCLDYLHCSVSPGNITFLYHTLMEFYIKVSFY